MDSKIFLKNYRKVATVFINKFFQKRIAYAGSIDPIVVNLLKSFQDYARGGKMLRGALTVLGYKMSGGTNTKAIIPVSLGIELLHNFLLIHDDVIDKDDLRRGKPTIHKKYSDGGHHRGISYAIITGDIGAFLGYELIVASSFPKEKIIRALACLNDYLVKTAYGQILDIEFDSKKNITWDEILKVRTYKTAYYTFAMPLSVGAILAGAEKSKLSAIEKYSLPIGIAFQLVDDVLGIFGNINVTGKSNESDIKDGKKTLLFARALELANKKEKQFLSELYGSNKITKENIEKIRNIIRKSGAVEASFSQAEELIRKGKHNIKDMTDISKYQKTLGSLADYTISRKK